MFNAGLRFEAETTKLADKRERREPMKILSEIAKEALELSPGQRRTLARILLDLSEDDQDFSSEVEAAWEDQICRRMRAVKAGTARSRSMSEVMADLDARFGS
jgi:hypothetical protein